jgi:SAM-dependent methyltransferase
MGRLADLYNATYATLAGRGASLRPWHFQWLAGRRLHREVSQAVGRLEGHVLDVGCGDKPFDEFMDRSKVTDSVGLDIIAGPHVDIVIQPDGPWPFEDAAFDGILCIEVLEHVDDLALLLSELNRVLKPGGRLILSVPFNYPFHGIVGMMGDYRRFTAPGLTALLAPHFRAETIVRCGAVGSVCGYAMLLAIDSLFNRSFLGRLIKGVTLPVYLPVCFVLNMLARIADALDPDQAFYTHVVYRGWKRS